MFVRDMESQKQISDYNCKYLYGMEIEVRWVTGLINFLFLPRAQINVGLPLIPTFSILIFSGMTMMHL